VRFGGGSCAEGLFFQNGNGGGPSSRKGSQGFLLTKITFRVTSSSWGDVFADSEGGTQTEQPVGRILWE